jgi:hypothetical protein
MIHGMETRECREIHIISDATVESEGDSHERDTGRDWFWD